MSKVDWRRLAARLILTPLAFGVASVFAWQPPQPPALLAQALKSNPELRLAAPGSRPVWLVRDTDRDKRDDVVAVVVQPLPAPAQFGVIAVHARAPQEIEWAVPLDVVEIHGLDAGPAADTFVPLFCVDCDSNIWFRWGGDEYETELFAVGEQLQIGSETQEDLPLRSAPNPVSKPSATVPHCTTAVVLKVGGTPDERWYFVEAPGAERGWVPDRFTTSDICMGWLKG